MPCSISQGFVELTERFDIDVDALLLDQGKLQDVLKYHVVPGAFAARDLQGMERLETLQGGFLEPEMVGDGDVVINGRTRDAMVLVPDIKAGEVSRTPCI